MVSWLLQVLHVYILITISYYLNFILIQFISFLILQNRSINNRNKAQPRKVRNLGIEEDFIYETLQVIASDKLNFNKNSVLRSNLADTKSRLDRVDNFNEVKKKSRQEHISNKRLVDICTVNKWLSNLT